MRTISLQRTLWPVLLSFLFSGCAKEIEQQQPQEGLHEVVFHAGWEPETKTVLQEDGSVWWSPGDEIGIVPFWQKLDGSIDYDARVSRFVSINSDYSSETDFVCHDFTDMDDATKYVAVYPYKSIYLIQPESFMVTIPTVQTATGDSFDRNAFVSVAVSDDKNLNFKNLCGGIKFSVSQEWINEVSFKYLNGDAMSGRLLLSYDINENKNKQCVPENGEISEVIVRAPDNSHFEVGKYYYVSMFPSENNRPIRVTLKKDSEIATFLTKGKTSIKRSVFKRLYSMDSGLIFKPYKNGATMLRMFPDGVEKDKITEVYFHPSSNKVTNINCGTEDEPVYFEQKGTIIHYYTEKEYFNLKHVTSGMFSGCKSLVKVDFEGIDTIEAESFESCFAECRSLKQVDLSNFNTSNSESMARMFCGCRSLEYLDLSSFCTETVVDMEAMFAYCLKLKHLDLSSFNTSACYNMENFFGECLSLQELDIAHFNFSSYVESSLGMFCHAIGAHSKYCVIRAPEDVKERMIQSINVYSSYANSYIQWVDPGMPFPTYSDPYAELYKSSDFSKDGTYKQIQKATKGKGIDIVLMGEAYSDRLINDGKYDDDLNRAVNLLFSEAPLCGLKEFFNIYIMYAVSENESRAGITAFDTGISSKIVENWMDRRMYWYLRPSYNLENYLTILYPNWPWIQNRVFQIVIMKDDGDFTISSQIDMYKEAEVLYCYPFEDDNQFYMELNYVFGQFFGLAPEIEGEWTESDYQNAISKGNGQNIDLTDDSNEVKWSHFLNNKNYSNENLGVFKFGDWTKSTESSTMSKDSIGFNAPCREAIYKRVHEMAYDNWKYNFDEFVTFDKNVKPKTKGSDTKITHFMKRVNPIVLEWPRRKDDEHIMCL